MATNQSNTSRARRNGFLVFLLGSMIAVAGATKLNEGERIIRIRQAAQQAASRQVKKVVKQVALGQKSLSPKGKSTSAAQGASTPRVMSTRDEVLSFYQLRKEGAQPRKQLLAKVKTLLQVSYIRLVYLSVARLHIRQPRAVGAELEPRLLDALANQLLPSPASKAKPKTGQTGRKVPRLSMERQLLTAMAQQLMGGNKKEQRKAKLPKAVRDVLAMLIDQAARHLTPYVMWEALLDASVRHIVALAQQKASRHRVALTIAIQEPMAAAHADKALIAFVRSLVRGVGKALGLKSLDWAFHPDRSMLAVLSAQMQPRLGAQQATALAMQMTSLLCRQIALHFAHALATKVGLPLQFSLTQVLSAGPATRRKQPAAALVRRGRPTPVTSPTTARTPVSARAPAFAPTSRPVRRAAPTRASARTSASLIREIAKRSLPSAGPGRERPVSRLVQRQPATRPVAVKQATRPTSREAVQVQTARGLPVARGQARVQSAPVQAVPLDPLRKWRLASLLPPTVRPMRVGFLVSSRRIGGWPSSTPIFVLGALVAFCGLLMWRKAIRLEVEARLADQQEDHTNPFALLKALQPSLEKLQEDLEGLDEAQVCERVDQLLSSYILPFAEVRQRVIEELGMTNGAEILVTVAFGERMLNRVWSAASDGHLPEALAVFPDAAEALVEAHEMAQRQLAHSS